MLSETIKSSLKSFSFYDVDITSALRWIYLGVFAIAISGVYSIVLVLSRAPYSSAIFSSKEIFRTALVIHVNLSVIVWMLSVTVALWCLTIGKQYSYWLNYANYIGFFGVMMMTISPALGASNPIINNYVPMLENWCFISGIAIFGFSVLIPLTLLLVQFRYRLMNILDYANISSAVLVLLSYSAFVCSYVMLQRLQYPLDLYFLYENIFWGGGHIIQFVFTESVMMVWLILISESTDRKFHFSALYAFLFILNLVLALPSIMPYSLYQIDSVEFIEFFTNHMKYCGGVAPTLLVMLCFLDMLSGSSSASWKITEKIPSKLASQCLYMSIILFFLGGFIGFLISGTNVTIPAHYHGSIVGISTAFMGFVYYMLNICDGKGQPYYYAIGQLLHIIGLSLSGGHGMLRKTPAGEFTTFSKITMSIMGLGGLGAILGGLIFVWICGRVVIDKYYK